MKMRDTNRRLGSNKAIEAAKQVNRRWAVRKFTCLVVQVLPARGAQRASLHSSRAGIYVH